MSANLDSQLSSFIDSGVIQGRFPAKNFQQKFLFEISEISRAQWNFSFRLHRPDPTCRVFGYFSCKQETKDRYWGQQFCQMERDISVRSTEMTRLVKVDHPQSLFRILRSDQTEVAGISMAWMESAPRETKWLQLRCDSFVSLSFCPKRTKKMHKWPLILLQMLIRKIVFDEELVEKITRTFCPI